MPHQSESSIYFFFQFFRHSKASRGCCEHANEMKRERCYSSHKSRLKQSTVRIAALYLEHERRLQQHGGFVRRW